MKICTKCKREKSKLNFYKDKSRADGLQKRCKLCVRTDHKLWREENSEKCRNWRIEYYKKNGVTICKKRRQWRHQNINKSKLIDSKHREKIKQLRIELKKQFGGRCQKCRYDRCFFALHFHHIFGRKGQYKRSGHVSVKEVQRYPDRFTLLCSNCHIELHQRGKF